MLPPTLNLFQIAHPSALGLKVGQEIMVKYYGRDPVSGAVRLSRKVLTMGVASAVKKLKNSTSRR
jgi:polyribonucleotide nucleotidyltransferase